jgi:hypothetical protein
VIVVLDCVSAKLELVIFSFLKDVVLFEKLSELFMDLKEGLRKFALYLR